MKKLLTLISLLFFSLTCFSQEFQLSNADKKIIDSLNTVLTNSKSDSLSCIINFKLSLIYGKNKIQSQSIKHLQAANKLIKENTYLKDLSYYYNVVNLQLSEASVKQLEIANNKLEKYNSSEVYSIRTKIYSNIGLFLQRQNKTLEAIKIFTTKAIPLAKKANNYQELAFLYKLIALVFYNNDDFTQAADYLDLSIKTLEEKPSKNIGYEKDLIETYLFYTEVLSVQKNIKKAELFLSKAKLLLKKNTHPNLYVEYYFAEGALLHERKDYTNEVKIYDKGIALAQSIGDNYADIRFNLLKFDVLRLQKKHEEAKDLLIRTLNHKYINLEDKAAYSKELALIYKQLNDYPNALLHFENYIVLNDSLNQMSYKNEIADLEAEFKNKENSIKINQLKIQKDSAELKAQNNRLKYSVFGITTVVLFILILFILLYQRKKNQLANEKHLKNRQEIKMLKNQKELEVIQAMVDGEELERKRIARELHDGIGSKLSALKIILSRLETNDNRYAENLDHINKLLGSSIKELRQISYNLVPESLLKLGLEKALCDLCHLLHSDSIKIEFQSFGIMPEIPIANQINIYRIVQELINNALKHAECDEILVSCSQNENTFYIAVEDNGIGFDFEKIKTQSGLGLKNIKNRIEILNGIFNLESSPNGTYYNIELNLDV